MKRLVGIMVLILGLLCVSGAMADFTPVPFNSDGIFGVPVADRNVTMRSFAEHSNTPRGVDLQVGEGEPLYAPFPGLVEFQQCYSMIGGSYHSSSYGNVAILHSDEDYIEGESKYVMKLAHMLQFRDDIWQYRKTDIECDGSGGRSYTDMTIHSYTEFPVIHVDAGDIIGYAGGTGNSTGMHCHVELYVDGSNNPINPDLYITNRFSAANIITTAFLDVNTTLNGNDVVNPSQAGTIEVYIDGQKWDDPNGYACDFCRQDIPIGSTYEIHFKPASGYWCNGVTSGSFTGTVAEGGTTVWLDLRSGSTSQPIPDGDYIIATVNHDSVADHFYFLDINGDDRTPALGQKVSIKEGSPTGDVRDYEAWTVSYSNGFYTIKQYTSSRVLDVHNRSVVSGDPICVSNPNGAGDDGNQRWRITRNGDYGYTLQAAHDGMCLNLDGMSVANKKVQQYPSDSSMAQGWMFIPYNPSQPVESGRYILVSALSDQAEFDVPNATNVPENQVVQIKKYSALNQNNVFIVNKLDNGYYSIQHEKSGKGLDVMDGSAEVSQQLSLHTYNGTTTQQWAILSKGNGKYQIVSRCNGYAIDVQGNNTADGTKIIQYPRGNGSNQQWKFVTPDDEAPVITETAETNVTETGATLSVKAIDNVGVDHVEFYVWHGDWDADRPNGITYQATLVDDVWTANIPLGLSEGDAWYVDVGAFDAEGNKAKSATGGEAVLFGFVKCTLTFDLDNGTCDETSRSLIYTSLTFYGNEREFLTAYGELPIPEKPGFEFAGWFDEEGNPVSEETLVTNREDHAIYAHWNVIDEEPPVVTNGVLSNITDNSATVTVTATDNVAVDHVLVEVHPGLWKGTHPTTFEAQQVGDSWVCDFTFDFEESTLSRFFVDAYDVAGNKSYSTTFTSDVLGYFIGATITYNANGGECETDKNEKLSAVIGDRVSGESTYPVLMGEMPVPLLENNTFLGWFDQSGSLITADSPVMSSQTLYAHWLRDYTNGKATISTDGNLITVSFTAPCVVVESDDGETYSRVIPSQGDQGYEFQTTKSYVAVAITGDSDLNAIVNGNDYIALKNYKKTPLEGAKAVVADLNADGVINTLDIAIFRRAFNVGLLHPAYQALSWYPLSPVYENTMTLPSALTTIEDESFAGIQAVNIVVPGTVTTIADDAFDDYVLLICPDDSYAAELAEANNIPHMESME